MAGLKKNPEIVGLQNHSNMFVQSGVQANLKVYTTQEYKYNRGKVWNLDHSSVEKSHWKSFQYVCSIWGSGKFKMYSLPRNTNIVEVRYIYITGV